MIEVKLQLDDKWKNMWVLIDATSLCSYTGIAYGEREEANGSISFILSDPSKTAEVAEQLKESLRLNVEKDKYVSVRDTFEHYEKDKRPRIYLTMPNGFKGLSGPSSFFIKPVITT